MEGRLVLRSVLESILYGMKSRNAFAALGPEMTEPNVGVGTAERCHGTDQGKGIPCSVEEIPCSGQKNSLFFRPQGIRIQHIEVTNKFLVFANAQGIRPQRIEMTKGIRAVLPKKPRIRKNSLLNSLFSVLHRALPDLQGMKPASTCCSHLLQRTTSVGLFLPREFGVTDA